MKLSLRNLAVAGALMTAGAAVAATPTVKLDWTKAIDKPDVVYNEARYGTGFGDKIYYMNKAASELWVYDHATDKTSKLATLPGPCGVGLTTDDAGNVLISASWAAADGTKFYIVTPEGEVSTLDVTLDPDIAAGRMDFLGRVAGNLMENAIFYTFMQNNTKVQMINVTNGVQNLDDFSFFSSQPLTFACGTNAICNPLYSFEELVDMGDDAVNAAAVRQRANKYVYTCDGKDWTALPAPANTTTNDAFDVFNLGGVDYQIIPTSITGKYNSGFSICDFEGNVIYSDYDADRELLNAAEGYTNGSAIIAHKVDENTVEIFTWYPMNSVHHAAKFTVSLPSEDPVAPLYACGTINNWSPENAVEMPYANGKWTLDLGTISSAAFKISTVKGPWDPTTEVPEGQNFNSGVLGLGDTDTQLVFGQKTALIPGAKNGNITISGKGTYVVEVTKEGETYYIELTGELAPIEAPEVEDVYLRGDFDSWAADAAYKFNDAGVEGSARKYVLYVKDAINGLFKIGDASDNWTVVNFGGEEGSTITIGPKYKLVQNGKNLTASNLADVTFVFRHSGDPAVASTLQLQKGDTTGVEAIEVADETPATYYNLQGVEVKAENLGTGIYVKVAGGKASKVIVK